MAQQDHQTTKQCERTYALGFLWLQLRLRSRQLFTSIPAVTLAVAAGRDAWVAFSKATSNNRTYAGLFLIFVVAPLSGVAYLILFDETVRNEQWYYSNNFYLFYMLSPHIHMTLTLTGVFLLFPDTDRRSYFLVVPITYHFAKIIWLVQVTSNKELNGFIPLAFWSLALFTSVCWMIMFNYLMTLHYHKRAGHVARAKGILAIEDIDNETKVRIALAELNSVK